MSGRDEGAVYYTGQAQFPDAVGGATATGPSRHTILQKFKEFIRNFQTDRNLFPYRESLVHNPKSLLVHLEDLLAFDAELPALLRSSPSDYLPLFETAAEQVLQGLRLKERGERGEMREPDTMEVQILLSSKEDPLSMRLLGAQYISRLVKIAGFTIAASRVKAKATYVNLVCKNCQSTKEVPCRPGLGGAIVPRSCDHIPQPGEEACPINPWMVVPDKSKYVDQRTLKLQENPEDVPTGELPRNMLLSVDRHLVQRIVPGTRLTIIGIYSIFQAAISTSSHKGAVSVRQPYVRVVGIEEANEADSRAHTSFTLEEIEEFKKLPDLLGGSCHVSARSRLYEICTANCWKSPLFECCCEEGPSHLKCFTYKVTVEIEEAPDMILECVGAPQTTKKAAAEHAAKGALWYLECQGGDRCGKPRTVTCPLVLPCTVYVETENPNCT